MRLRTPASLIIGVGLLAVVCIANACVAYRQAQQLHETASWVAHTHEVMDSLEQVASTIKDAETGARGFLLTDVDTYLTTYRDASQAYPAKIAHVAELITDNPHQQAQLARLQKLVSEKVANLARHIELRQTEGFEAARRQMLESDGQAMMDDIRNLVQEMKGNEQVLLEDRNRVNDRTYHLALLSALLAALVGSAAVAGFFWLLVRHLAAEAASAAEVHERREWLQATLASIGDGVIATNAEGHVTFLNGIAAALTGWSVDQAQGAPLDQVFNIINERTREKVVNPVRRALSEGRIVGLANHTLLIDRNGVERSIDDSAAPIRNRSGAVIGAILVFRDITDRNRQDEELKSQAAALQDADRRKNEFIAMLAHELRNPMAPISNSLEIWPLVENDKVEMEQLRAIMRRQVNLMVRLIDDLLDVSRITRGSIKLQFQIADLAALIRGAVETVKPLVDVGQHQLTVQLPDEPMMLHGDAARLTQVFANLLNNAAKYTPRGGKLSISAARDADQVTVRVRDNGTGIPPNMINAIFEMFRQVDDTLDRANGGLGIGLTLVKRFIELHGGTVEARSEGPNKGSEFVVTLPVIDPDAGPKALGQQEGTSHAAPQLPKLRVLVVDDLPASAKILGMMLSALGQDVTVLHEGPAAIEWVSAHDPDVVFLDIGMPKMDGYEVARQIRRRPIRSALMLVALTGFGQDEDRRRALEAGFNHHMVKPASMEALAKLLRLVPARELAR